MANQSCAVENGLDVIALAMRDMDNYYTVGDERHQSCLVLTSREKPIGLTAKGKTLPVRSLQLSGLPQVEAENTQAKGLVSKKMNLGT